MSQVASHWVCDQSLTRFQVMWLRSTPFINTTARPASIKNDTTLLPQTLLLLLVLLKHYCIWSTVTTNESYLLPSCQGEWLSILLSSSLMTKTVCVHDKNKCNWKFSQYMILFCMLMIEHDWLFAFVCVCLWELTVNRKRTRPRSSDR